MVSSVINSLRAFKDLYDLIFSDEKTYIDARTEFKNGIGYSIEQFKEGYNKALCSSIYCVQTSELLLGAGMRQEFVKESSNWKVVRF